MPGLLPDLDPDGLLEYSVVYTDRALNHMSVKFQTVMQDISSALKSVYSAEAVAIIPGGGTYAMEAVARQFAKKKRCLVIRNGFFSYRWSQILETGNIAESIAVLQARRAGNDSQAPFEPAPIDEVVEKISTDKPDIVFAPHVETASGILLPDDYLRQVAAAVHAQGGLFVLDCIASGAIWTNMKDIGVDILISAPQKGWSSPPCAGLVMTNAVALDALSKTKSDSFSCDLGKWLQIMRAYEDGGHAYHATMPTGALTIFRDAIDETAAFGFEKTRELQFELGDKVRALLSEKNFPSVAAPGFEAPGVVVSYTTDRAISSGARFVRSGLQIAAGVPLMCGEDDGFRTFRLGLFGLDKLFNIDRTVETLEKTLYEVAAVS
ncbi:aminotransferase class V-fold PLP-dependent enzyme [Hyphococcus sp.]|uniref:aminotransferase class V-fold PLP-dependent enzyme n=1 Tax=Hyphococcus sp. TaxID=2038636 RepID=UPI003CCC1542